MRPEQSWTTAEIEKLRELYLVETPLKKIAKALPNRTRSACSHKARELGLRWASRRNWTPREIAKLRELFVAGHTYKEIAVVLGRPAKCCASYGFSLGLRDPETNKRKDRIELALRLVRSGHSTRKAAKIATISRWTLLRHMKLKGASVVGENKCKRRKIIRQAQSVRWELEVARCESEGWPLGCKPKHARILAAIETFDRPALRDEIMQRAGLRHNGEVQSTLKELADLGWVQRKKHPQRKHAMEYVLSPSVIAGRASWQATKDAQAREAVPTSLENALVPESRSQNMFDITGHRGDGNAGMRIIKRKKQ